MSHVFISYVREDQEVIDKLCRDLMERGAEIWIDRNEILPGQRWKESIRKAIEDGDYFIASFSKSFETRAKTYMNEELILAIEELRQRPFSRSWFIPVMLDKCTIPAIPIGAGGTLLDIQFVQLFDDWEAGVQRICDVINPVAPEERLWQSILNSLFMKSMKARCANCGERYELDNISICSKCGNTYCRDCEHKFSISHCNCGGNFRNMSNKEWINGFELWKDYHNKSA